jgi:hypothetical protein
MFPWVNMAPLGRPVVPLVYICKTTSSRVRGAGAVEALALASSSS